MNFVFICTYIKRLYNVLIDNVIYDSDYDYNYDNEPYGSSDLIEQSNSSDYSSDISSDDLYMDFFSKKNKIEREVYLKKNICFVIIDEFNNSYGIYYPGIIDKKKNYSIGVSFFIFTKGIELVMNKYDFKSAFTYIDFSDESFIKIGSTNWLFKIYDNRIEFNKNQKAINYYNWDIMKNCKIKKLSIFQCKNLV